MSDKEKSKNSEKDKTEFSRRNFLKGASLAALGAAAADRAAGAAVGPQLQGPGPVALELKINNNMHKVYVEPRTTLAETLRESLGLTGTKVSCDRGSCSACTVLIDGDPVCSCMTLAIDVGDRSITTVEGLAHGDDLHPLQQAFIDKDAMMCGFCTPGMLMSCAALLLQKTSPSLDDVKAAVCGNLCRCGTYPKVFEATLAAAEATKGKNQNG